MSVALKGTRLRVLYLYEILRTCFYLYFSELGLVQLVDDMQMMVNMRAQT